MTGRKCSVLSCKNSALTNKLFGVHKSFYSFPRDENLRKKWIDACKRKIDNIVSARVCSDHFKDEDYLHFKNADRADESRKKRLKSDVVPSLNLDLNVESDKLDLRTFNNKLSNNENSTELNKGKIVTVSNDNQNTNEIYKRQSSLEQSSDQDSGKEMAKRKGTIKKTGDENINEQLKKKNCVVNSENLKLVSKRQINRVGNNKENSKVLTKKRSSLTNDNEGLKGPSKRKIVKNFEKENLKDVAKRKNGTAYNTQNFKDIQKRKISKGNSVKETIKKEKNILINDNEKKTQSKKNSPAENSDKSKIVMKHKTDVGNIKKENLKQLSEKKSSSESRIEDSKSIVKLKTDLDSSVKDNTKRVTTNKTCNDNEYLDEIPKKKIAIESINNKEDIKKLLKRRVFTDNGIPKKRRIRFRLGKDDSEDSDESEMERKVVNNNTNDNKHKITYKSPSEMKDNVDLLKYLNYLKEKQSTDQPILFLADE